MARFAFPSSSFYLAICFGYLLLSTRPSFYFFQRKFIDDWIVQLLDTEVKRKIKKEPALAVEMKNDAFTSDVNAQDEGDIVRDLWNFS